MLYFVLIYFIIGFISGISVTICTYAFETCCFGNRYCPESMSPIQSKTMRTLSSYLP